MNDSLTGHFWPKLDQPEYDSIFDILCQPGADLSKVIKALPGYHRGTLTRAFRLADEVYRKKGVLSTKEIKEVVGTVGYGVAEPTVKKVIDHYNRWDLTKNAKNIRDEQALASFDAVYNRFQTSEKDRRATQARQRDEKQKLQRMQQDHVHDQIEFAKVLRSCVSNPASEECDPEVGQIPMSVNGYDWRLDPMTWFHLVTPYLMSYDTSKAVKELWGSDFPDLRKHTDKSEFWGLLENLQTKVNSLQEDYAKVAAKIGEKDSKFYSEWLEIQSYRTNKLDPRRFLGHTKPETKKFQPIYDSSYADEVVTKFRIPKLKKIKKFNFPRRHMELEELLQKVYDCLEPHIINKIITEGHCENCPK
jgi:hypothetical protein